MATTTPDSLYYPVGTDGVAPLHTVLANMQTSVQTAMSKRQRTSYVWTNQAARDAQTGMTAGSTGYQLDTKTEYVFNGTIWQIGTPYAEFSGTTQTGDSNGYKAFTGLALDTATSTTTTDITTTGSNFITLVNPGVYSLSMYTTVSAATTGFTMVGTSTSATTDLAPQLSRGPFVSDNVSTLSLPLYRSTVANQNLYFYFRIPTGINNIVPRIRIGRVA